MLDGESEVLPGMTIVPTPGHTPGHCSFLVASGRERAVVLGDAIHCPLQITHPEWNFVADANPEAAVAARERLLRELDEPATTVVGAHFPDAIFGRRAPGNRPPPGRVQSGSIGTVSPGSRPSSTAHVSARPTRIARERRRPRCRVRPRSCAANGSVSCT